jgi:hypothetical protein
MAIEKQASAARDGALESPWQNTGLKLSIQTESVEPAQVFDYLIVLTEPPTKNLTKINHE